MEPWTTSSRRGRAHIGSSRCPTRRFLPSDADPFEQAALRQSTRLAFVAALQHLPLEAARGSAPHRGAWLVRSRKWPQSLDMSIAAVNSALQRARATLAPKNVSAQAEPLSESQAELLEKYVDAFHEYDVDALVALMRDDATLSMPPYTLWLQGPAGNPRVAAGPWQRMPWLAADSARRPAARRRLPNTGDRPTAGTTRGR